MVQHNLLIARAKALGIAATDLSELLQKPAALLEFGDISELVVEGVPTSWINVRSQYYCDNKQLGKMAFEDLGIPHPQSLVFQNPSEAGLYAFFKEGQSYVCKPLEGTNGEGVITDIRSLKQVVQYHKSFQHLESQFLLEEQVAGTDLRVQVLGGKIVAACIREPAFVLGNGRDSLETLIEKRRAVMRTQNPGNKLEIDAATGELLAKQGISMDNVPEEGKKVQLKYVSNMAQGGIATDVTEEIHPLYHHWVGALVSFLRSEYFGLDIMTADYSQDPNAHSQVLEINARAEWLHHTFSERRTHDMAGMILRAVFGLG